MNYILLVESTRWKKNIKVYIDKTLSLLDAELELLKIQLTQQSLTSDISNKAEPESSSTTLQWTSNIVDLVELIYALQASNCINHGKASLKQIIKGFESLFTIKIQYSSLKFVQIRERAKERLAFIKKLYDNLLLLLKERD